MAYGWWSGENNEGHLPNFCSCFSAIVQEQEDPRRSSINLKVKIFKTGKRQIYIHVYVLQWP